MGHTTARALALVWIAVLSGAAAAQCGLVDRDSPAAVSQEVNRIFNETLDGMQYTLPSGIRATTWMPPADPVRDQVKCLGAVAVPAITDLLRSNRRSFGTYLAIQMLGWAGGAEIVPPLVALLTTLDDSQLMLKLAALESLASAPPDKALPIVQKVMRSEKNQQLLQEAASVEARLQGSGK